MSRPSRFAAGTNLCRKDGRCESPVKKQALMSSSGPYIAKKVRTIMEPMLWEKEKRGRSGYSSFRRW